MFDYYYIGGSNYYMVKEKGKIEEEEKVPDN